MVDIYEISGIVAAAGVLVGVAYYARASMVLALRKDLVDMKNAEEGFVGIVDDKKMALIFSQGITAVAKNGILGDSRMGEAEKGEEYLELLAEKIADIVRKQVEI